METLQTTQAGNLSFWADSARTQAEHLYKLSIICARGDADPVKVAELLFKAAENAQTIAKGIETA